MKGIALISGGKDSYLSALIALINGIEIEKTITIKAQTDSMMFHFPNAILGSAVSKLLGLENIIIEESEFESSISEYKGYRLIAGAIASEYQKTRLERLCLENEIIPYFPLWRRNQEDILREFMESGSEGILVSVSAEGLDEKYLGRKIDESLLNDLKRLNMRYGVSLVGEGGEYESLVTFSPWTGMRLQIMEKEIVDRGMQKLLIIKSYKLIKEY